MKYIVMVLCIIASNPVFSLSCARISTKDKIQAAKIIFIGQIDKIISSKEIVNKNPWDAERKIVASLRVLRTIRGSTKEHQLVVFSYRVEIGQKYIIFDNSAFSSMCSFSASRRLEESGKLLKLLDIK